MAHCMTASLCPIVRRPDKSVIAMQWRCLVLLTAVAVGVNSQANVDTMEPIVRAFPEVNPTGNEYFGYSVLLHQLSIPTDRASSLETTRYFKRTCYSYS